MNVSNRNVFGETHTLVDVLQWRAHEQSDQVTYTFLEPGEAGDASFSNRDLERRAQAIGARLQSLTAAGERVLLLLAPGLDYVSAFFGCLYSGAIAVPVYPPRVNRTSSRIQAIINDAQPRVILATRALLSKLNSQQDSLLGIGALIQVAIDEIGNDIADHWQSPSIESDSLAFLQYTSGSTAIPKGVMVSHRNLLHNLGLISQKFEATHQSCGVIWLPPYHDMGLIGGILQPLYAGFKVALMRPVDFLQQPIRWLKIISQYRADISGGPNFAYELCISRITPEATEELDLSTWNVAFSGAEPVRATTIDRFAKAFESCGFRREAFYPCYGMAESTLFITGGRKDDPPVVQSVDSEALQNNRVVDVDRHNAKSSVLVGCGHGASGQSLIIVHPETCEICAGRQVGEIWVRSSSSVTQGYWNQPEKTQSVFHAYVSNTGEGPFLRTGDLGFLQNGELFITGRLKDLIIIRGRNYYPQDVELTVEQSHPVLRPGSGAAFTVDIDTQEQLVIVQEVHRHGLRSLNVPEVVQAIRQAVTEHHDLRVHAILLLKTGSIPKTSSGKIQRHACRQEFHSKTLNVVGNWLEPTPDKNRASYLEQGATETATPDTSAGYDALRADATSVSAVTIEKWLVARIARHFDIPPHEVNCHDPFVSYGLDSAAAVSLSGELEEWLGRSLSPTLVYDYPSIIQLAQHLAGDGTSEVSENNDVTSGPVASGYQHNDIAIVGIGCRFPEADSPDEFWNLLSKGRSAVKSMTDKRLTLDGAGQISHDGASQVGGFLKDVDRFDAAFFGISPREAEKIDPQQRWLLEVAWEALENAGQPPDQLSGTQAGVFVGISSNDYARRLFDNHHPMDAYVSTGNALSIAANRLSYALDLQGPSLAVDTACSSSLVAVHLACQSLKQGECNLALAGGVNALLSPELTQVLSKAQMLASDGRCKTFDVDADGYVRGEGCGIVVLKRLSEARTNGDRILAVIRGSAINQDGRSNGLTAPNGPSQQAVIRQALTNAKVAPADIQYVETHGTGTPLGDPIEVDALQAVLATGRSPDSKCYLGSVKTNVGHLESAAGIAGLIKGVLALQHQEIPPHLNLTQLNPYINLQQPTFNIAIEAQVWSAEHPLQLAGVSSFGFGGTNAHIILEAAGSGRSPNALAAKGSPQTSSHSNVEHAWQLLTLSAKTESALRSLARCYQTFLSQVDDGALADICFTANMGRTHFSHRMAIATMSKIQLQDQLSQFLDCKSCGGVVLGSGQTEPQAKIAFLFTGQGSQYVNMGRQLYDTCLRFRQILERCDRILQNELGESLLSILYPSNHEQEDRIDQTCYTQPALFALEYALAELWQTWGIKPDVVMGHSVGEYVAACVAGVFDLTTGLKLIAARARLMQALPSGGKMAVVFAAAAWVKDKIASYQQTVTIAAINGPQSVVISGPGQDVDALLQQLERQRIRTHILNVSHAFHSPLMAPMLAEFEQVAKAMSFTAPKIPFISNLTGQLWPADTIPDCQYWVNHVSAPVQFYAGMQTLQQQSCSSIIEIGPNPILLGMGRYCWPEDKTTSWLPSLKHEQSDWQQLLESLAHLYARGVDIQWPGFAQDHSQQRVALPTYPFENQRYWLSSNPPSDVSLPEPSSLTQLSGHSTRDEHPLLGRALLAAAHRPGEHTWLGLLDPQRSSYLGEHCLWGNAVLFLGAYIEMALAAARAARGPSLEHQLSDLQLHTPLFLPKDTPCPVQVVLVEQPDDSSQFQVYSQAAKSQTARSSWVLHASATVHHA